MERISTQDFQLALGIRNPWSISNIDVDSPSRTITVTVSADSKKNRSFFRQGVSARNKDEGTYEASWRHINLGDYKTIIHASVPKLPEESEGISRSVLIRPSFLGDNNRKYSNHFRQQIALSRALGINDSAICEIFPYRVTFS